MCFHQLCWDQFEVISPRSVFFNYARMRADKRVQYIERSNFTLLWPRQIYWPATVRPPLCSNDYWLLIDSFINCELLRLVPYHGVHVKTLSAGLLRSLRGRGWAAAAETEHRERNQKFPGRDFEVWLWLCHRSEARACWLALMLSMQTSD